MADLRDELSQSGGPRLLDGSDWPALAQLHARCFPDEPWSVAAWESLTAIDGTLVLGAAEPGGCLRAFCALRRQFEEAEVISIGVDPAHRRLGHGRQLLQGGLALLSAMGTERVVLEVAEDNAEALALYRSLGFAPIGRRRGYYRRVDGRTGDAALLECRLR